MKILFGASTRDKEGSIKGPKKARFYYGVEYLTNPGGADEFVVYDGVGRSVPILITDITDIDALISSLTRISARVAFKNGMDKDLEDSLTKTYTQK